MKKLLLKMSLVCLGITLLCGFYSFRNSDGKKFQNNIKEVVVESNDCTYNLYVEESVSWWYLKLKNNCPDPIIATCKWTIYYENGSKESFSETVRVNGNWETVVDRGDLDRSSCTADNVSAKFAN